MSSSLTLSSDSAAVDDGRLPPSVSSPRRRASAPRRNRSSSAVSISLSQLGPNSMKDLCLEVSTPVSFYHLSGVGSLNEVMRFNLKPTFSVPDIFLGLVVSVVVVHHREVRVVRGRLLHLQLLRRRRDGRRRRSRSHARRQRREDGLRALQTRVDYLQDCEWVSSIGKMVISRMLFLIDSYKSSSWILQPLLKLMGGQGGAGKTNSQGRLSQMLCLRQTFTLVP